MRRGSGFSVAVAGLLPLLPGTLIVVAESLPDPTSALLLLAAVLAACVLGGAVGGIIASVVAAFVFALMVLPPRFGLAPSPSGLSSLLVFAGAAAGMVAIAARLDRVARARTQAEDLSAALAEQTRMLAPVLEDSPIGVAVFDTDLRYMYVNRQLAEANRRGVAEHLGRTMGEVLAAEHAELLEPPLRQVLATGQRQLDVSLSAPVEGVTRHYLVNRYPVRAPQGELLGVAVTVQDVTERQRLADLEVEAGRLRETAELAHRLQAAQRIAGFGSWEIDLASGRLDWSAQMCAILGVDSAPAGFDEAWRLVHPEDAEETRRHLDRLISDGTPYTVETRMIRADGRVIAVLTSAEAVHDGAGRVSRVWGTTIDVTAQRAAETAARDAIRAAEASRAQLAVEHGILQMFQHAMLPASVPEIPGVDLAVAYRSHSDHAEIGGDWYDAFTLPDGRLALAIGDVTGHDLQAATVMGQVRNAVRAYAVQDPRPGLVLQRTNALLRALPELKPTTMIFGVYDPGTCTLTWSRAGHPPPLHHHAGTVTMLDRPGGVLLGARSGAHPYAEASLELAGGDTLLWYTDGLIERRGGDILAAERKLEDLLAAQPATADAHSIVATLDRAMIADGALHDDVCLLVLQPRHGTGPAGPG